MVSLPFLYYVFILFQVQCMMVYLPFHIQYFSLFSHWDQNLQFLSIFIFYLSVYFQALNLYVWDHWNVNTVRPLITGGWLEMKMYDWCIVFDEDKYQENLIYIIPFECKVQKLVQNNEMNFSLKV